MLLINLIYFIYLKLMIDTTTTNIIIKIPLLDLHYLIFNINGLCLMCRCCFKRFLTLSYLYLV